MRAEPAMLEWRQQDGGRAGAWTGCTPHPTPWDCVSLTHKAPEDGVRESHVPRGPGHLPSWAPEPGRGCRFSLEMVSRVWVRTGSLRYRFLASRWRVTIPETFCLPVLMPRRRGVDSGRKDLPARGAQKDGHPWDTLRMPCRVGLPLWPCLGPESKSGIQLPQHVGTRSADAAIFNNESDLQSLKRFQINAGKWGVISWAPSVFQKVGKLGVHGTQMDKKCFGKLKELDPCRQS